MKDDVLLSFCIPVHNRTHDLQRIMPNLITAAKLSPPVELAIADYNSTDGLEEYIKSVQTQEPWLKIAYRKYTGRDYYHNGHARNLCMLLATGDYLIVFATDHYVTEDFLPTIRQLIAENDPDWLHTSGDYKYVMIMKRQVFIDAGGYDERIELYGPEDRELFARLARRGLKGTFFPKGMVDGFRTQIHDKKKNYRLKLARKEMSARMTPFYEQSLREQTMVANEGSKWGQWEEATIGVTVITCSFNKPEYVSDAIKSVLNQSYKNFEFLILENSTDGVTKKIVRRFKDPRLRIIDEELSDRHRRKTYPESYLKNKYTPLARGKYIFYLADDDVLEPDCFAEHIRTFEANPDQRANYHSYSSKHLNGAQPDSVIVARKTFGRHRDPNGRVDGGSVMFEKSLLGELQWPYFRGNWGMAHFSDGTFLKRLAQITDIYPIDKVLHTKRHTDQSAHYPYRQSLDDRPVILQSVTFKDKKAAP